MRKRKLLLIAIICFSLATALTVLFVRDPQPHYNGRSLSQWLVLCSQHYTTQNDPEFRAAAKAIRSIGTNALPYLLKWIRYEPPPWQHVAITQLPESFSESAPGTLLIEGPGYERAKEATLGFAILGTNAASAIADLKTMMADTNQPRTAVRSIAALARLGPPALPHMIGALFNTNQPYRVRIAVYLAAFMARDVGTNACVPPLVAVLDDPDPQVRTVASRMLGWLTNAPAQ